MKKDKEIEREEMIKEIIQINFSGVKNMNFQIGRVHRVHSKISEKWSTSVIIKFQNTKITEKKGW